jgi:hypothetical protein
VGTGAKKVDCGRYNSIPEKLTWFYGDCGGRF